MKFEKFMIDDRQKGTNPSLRESEIKRCKLLVINVPVEKR